MKIGYARVSTKSQDIGNQLLILKEHGCDTIFQDVISGTKKNRPGLNLLLHHVKPGDEVIICRFSRLGRSTKDMIDIVRKWHSQNISLYSIDEKTHFDNTVTGRLLVSVLGAFSEMERDMIAERTKKGLERARQMGRIGGRPPGISEESKIKCQRACFLYQKGEMSVSKICKEVGIARSTMYSYLRREGVLPPKDGENKLKVVKKAS